MQFVACLLAALEDDGQYDRDEFVEPLLFVVVRAVEELDEVHVICLRRGERVSGAASSARATPADRCVIVKRQTDFLPAGVPKLLPPRRAELASSHQLSYCEASCHGAAREADL